MLTSALTFKIASDSDIKIGLNMLEEKNKKYEGSSNKTISDDMKFGML